MSDHETKFGKINTKKSSDMGLNIKLPTIGRMVHFFPYKKLTEGWGGDKKVYPAIIVEAVDNAPAMTVFTDIGPFYYPTVIPKSMAFNTGGDQVAHYWDWPEIK